jgi:hypothetical protein
MPGAGGFPGTANGRARRGLFAPGTAYIGSGERGRRDRADWVIWPPQFLASTIFRRYCSTCCSSLAATLLVWLRLKCLVH